MDTILNDYIQDYLHSDKFIEMLEYFVAKYNENADSIRKSGLHKSAEFLDDAKDKLLTLSCDIFNHPFLYPNYFISLFNFSFMMCNL